MDEDRVVQFDTQGQVRVYDPDKFEEAQKTLRTQQDYVSKMDQFRTAVTATMSIVQQLGKAIEQEKLRAIGARNAVESEGESRKRALRETELRLQEKRSELDRYVAEHTSLQKVEQEQRAIIQRLSFSGE